MSGKGSHPRPIPDRPRYEAEFDRIFRKSSDEVQPMPAHTGSGEAVEVVQSNEAQGH